MVQKFTKTHEGFEGKICFGDSLLDEKKVSQPLSVLYNLNNTFASLSSSSFSFFYFLHLSASLNSPTLHYKNFADTLAKRIKIFKREGKVRPVVNWGRVRCGLIKGGRGKTQPRT